MTYELPSQLKSDRYVRGGNKWQGVALNFRQDFGMRK
jgi:hypothetical protein